jgi:hypothetical protein
VMPKRDDGMLFGAGLHEGPITVACVSAVLEGA